MPGRTVRVVGLPTLAQLVDAVAERSAGRRLDDVTTALEFSAELSRLGDELVHRFVGAARDEGYSWAQIATSLRVSRQAAQQRYGVAPGAGSAPFAGDGSRDKPAPFSGARFDPSSGVEVQLDVGGAWHRLVELDGLPVDEVLRVCRASFGRRWLKRFSEDLDEVYADLGLDLGASVEVVVADSLGRSSRRRVAASVEKRKAAWRYNIERAQAAATGSAVRDGGRTGERTR